MAPSDTNEKRPAKKARLDLPDGFTKSTNSTKKIAHVKFVSAFETRSPGAKQIGPTVKASEPPGPLAPAGPLVDSTTKKPPALRVLKPPQLPILNPAQEASGSKRLTSLVSRPPIPLPQKNTEARLTSITSLRPRPATPPSNKKLQPLKSMAPPPIAGPSRIPASEMKTIFTTNVALATDIRSESGQAEVLSLYLQQHGHGFVDPNERELQRGLETSPEKLSKRTKNAKFARGGLTDRARVLLKQRQTALSLWQASLELELRANRRPAPDMRLRVNCILHAAREADHLRATHPPCLALLRCAIMPEFRQEEVLLLLNFDAASGASPVRFHKITGLQAGREIFIWKTWQTLDISFPLSAELLALSNSEVVHAVASAEAGAVRTVLFCTRFWLAPF